ncbi:MAG: glycosyltransferase family 2 protein [Ignavibacteriae bacterium]|nr:glycosyltransferase family 2 protein [Ignavibacteriota bacterium]
MPPLVSVILPTYNRAALLPRAIDSVRGQSLTDWELIVVDDGGTDDTPAVLARYQAMDGRIRAFRQENAGPAAARNAGFVLARGAYIAFLDSDDEYLTDHLLLRAQMLDTQSGVDALHGGVLVADGDPLVPDATDPSRLIHIDACAVGGTFFLRRRLLESGLRWTGGYAEDAALLAALKRRAVVLRVDFPTYVYHRDTPDSRCADQRERSGTG